MSDNFSDFNSAARLRETVRAIVREVISNELPTEIFASVVNVTPADHTAQVQIPGQAESFSVPTGAILPLPGATVVLSGKPGRYKISRIISSADVVRNGVSFTAGPKLTIAATDEQADLIIDSGGTTGTRDARIRFNDDGIPRWILSYDEGLDRFRILRYDETGVFQEAPIELHGNGDVLIKGDYVIPESAWSPAVGGISGSLSSEAHGWSFANGECSMWGFGVLGASTSVNGTITIDYPPGISRVATTFRIPVGLARYNAGGDYMGPIEGANVEHLELAVQSAMGTIALTGANVPGTWADGHWFGYRALFPADYAPSAP